VSKNFDTAETIAELDGEKSNLLMEAYVLIGTGEPEQAIERYALAAPMEVRIAAFYQKQGDAFMATRHRFSAAVCYAKSGSLRDALKLFDAMGRDRDIPEYKGDALMWAARLRQKQRESLQAYGHSLQSVG
jgi:pentatricopeptide repeat protein